MSDHRWGALGLLALGVVLLLFGAFVLSFLGEPSAVGRLRAAIEVIGGALVLVAAVAALFGVRMLIRPRT